MLSNFQVPQEDEAIFWLHVYTGVWVLLSTGDIVGWEENHLNPTDMSSVEEAEKLTTISVAEVSEVPKQLCGWSWLCVRFILNSWMLWGRAGCNISVALHESWGNCLRICRLDQWLIPPQTGYQRVYSTFTGISRPGKIYAFSLLWIKTPAYFPLKDTLVGVDFWPGLLVWFMVFGAGV